MESCYPIVYRRGDPLSTSLETQVRKVRGTRKTADGFEFLLEWSEELGGNQTWVPTRTLGSVWSEAFEQALSLPLSA